MIARVLDSIVAAVSPLAGVRRKQARKLLRAYSGAEANRLNANKRPGNKSADQELAGPYGADAMRARARMLVRDNAWAWGVVDTIVSSVVGTGIGVQSMYERPDGSDVEDINEKRDAVWREWCEVCDVNGQYTFAEIQALALREMVEAGECLVHMVTVPRDFNGVLRPVPLALELIEADRLATERDTFLPGRRDGGNRVVRGVEINELGKPVAYWVYPDHPTSPQAIRRTPERIPAANILHLFRRDRIGQTRGISWFAPVVSWLSDLGVYVDNELQASAVASCFTVAIKSNGTPTGLLPPSTDDETTDSVGNTYEYLQPGLVMRLQPDESIESANPGRPNSASEPWINLMLRGIAVGTGLSYEIVARDFSQTNYSSNRASQLEDRRRFRRWQRYLINHLCQPVWDRFFEAAIMEGRPQFGSMTDLLADRRAMAPAEFMPPSWEWVDPVSEQQSSESAIKAFQATYADELGAKGLNYRHVFYQRAKEERLLRQLGLVSPTAAVAAEASAATPQAEQQAVPQASGEFAGLTTMQFNRNRKAIGKILDEYASGIASEAQARVFLSGIGMTEANIDALLADAKDGTVDSLPAEAAAT